MMKNICNQFSKLIIVVFFNAAMFDLHIVKSGGYENARTDNTYNDQPGFYS